MAKSFVNDLKRKRDPLESLAPTSIEQPISEPSIIEEETVTRKEVPTLREEVVPEPPPPRPKKKQTPQKVGRPVKHKVELERFTVKLKKEVLDDIRAIAYWDRVTVQDLFWKALDEVRSSYPETDLRKAKRAYKKK